MQKFILFSIATNGAAMETDNTPLISPNSESSSVSRGTGGLTLNSKKGNSKKVPEKTHYSWIDRLFGEDLKDEEKNEACREHTGAVKRDRRNGSSASAGLDLGSTLSSIKFPSSVEGFVFGEDEKSKSDTKNEVCRQHVKEAAKTQQPSNKNEEALTHLKNAGNILGKRSVSQPQESKYKNMTNPYKQPQPDSENPLAGLGQKFHDIRMNQNQPETKLSKTSKPSILSRMRGRSAAHIHDGRDSDTSETSNSSGDISLSPVHAITENQELPLPEEVDTTDENDRMQEAMAKDPARWAFAFDDDGENSDGEIDNIVPENATPLWSKELSPEEQNVMLSRRNQARLATKNTDNAPTFGSLAWVADQCKVPIGMAQGKPLRMMTEQALQKSEEEKQRELEENEDLDRIEPVLPNSIQIILFSQSYPSYHLI